MLTLVKFKYRSSILMMPFRARATTQQHPQIQSEIQTGWTYLQIVFTDSMKNFKQWLLLFTLSILVFSKERKLKFTRTSARMSTPSYPASQSKNWPICTQGQHAALPRAPRYFTSTNTTQLPCPHADAQNIHCCC